MTPEAQKEIIAAEAGCYLDSKLEEPQERSTFTMQAFGETFFPDRLKAATTAYQAEICAEIDALESGVHMISKEHFRGSGKTTWVGIILPIYWATHKDSYCILILGHDADNAALRLKALRDEFDYRIERQGLDRIQHPNNPLLHEHFTIKRGDIWQHDQFHAMADGRTVVFHAVGAGQNMRGIHGAKGERPDLAILDDVDSDQAARSPTISANLRDFVDKALLPAMDPQDATIVSIGTRIHPQGLVAHIGEKPGFEVSKMPALDRLPDCPLWDTWREIYNSGQPDRFKRARAFYDENRESMDAGVTVAWPERFPLYGLMCIREDMGPAQFAAEFLGQPYDADAALFDMTRMKSYGDNGFDVALTQHPGQFQWFLAIDPALGKKANIGKGDYSAAVLAVVDRESQIRYCVKTLAYRLPLDEFLELVLGIASEAVAARRQLIIGIEDVGFQSAWIDDVEKALRKRGLPCPVIRIPHTGRNSKLARFKTVAPSVHDWWRFLPEHLDMNNPAALGHQLMWADGSENVHDDLPDALEMAEALAREYVVPAGTEPDELEVAQDLQDFIKDREGFE